MKGQKSSSMLPVLVAVVVIGALAYAFATGLIKVPTQLSTTPVEQPVYYPMPVDTGQPAPIGSTQFTCPQGLTPTAQISVQNPDSSTLMYLNAPVAITKASGTEAGKVIATGTATTGATLSYASVNIPCDSDVANNGVTVYTTSTTAFTSGAPVTKYLNGGTSLYADLISRNTTTPTLRLLTTAYVNDTTTADGATVILNADTLGAGSSDSRILRIFPPASPSQYGGDGTVGTIGGVMFSIDTVNSTNFNNNGVSLSQSSGATLGLTEVPCSTTATNVRSANRCYTSSPISATKTGGSADVLVTWNNLQDPQAGGSDFVVYIDDITCFVDSGSVIKCDIADSANTPRGAANVQALFDQS